MIPRVRLLYLQGLAAAHEDLRDPRLVILTTDGERLVVASASSTRPLARFPISAVDGLTVGPATDLVTPRNRELGSVHSGERLLQFMVKPGTGVPAAVTQQPVLFAAHDHANVDARLPEVQVLLVPRDAAEMARLEKGDRRVGTYYFLGVVLAILFALLLILAFFLLVIAPRQPDRADPGPLGPPAALTIVA